MDRFFDDLSRRLAKAMSRRDALGLAAAPVLAAVALGCKNPFSPCPNGVVCGDGCCNGGKPCCSGGCCSNTTDFCCGSTACCSASSICCGTYCCPVTEGICCGGGCCPLGTFCTSNNRCQSLV